MEAGYLATLLSDIGRFINDHTLAAIVIGGLTLRGFFDFIERKFAFLLDWLLRMRRIWIKFKNDWKHAASEKPPVEKPV